MMAKQIRAIKAIALVSILIIISLTNSGCVGNLKDTVSAKKDSNPLYCGEDNWFITTLDFDVYVKAYGSKTEEVNKATQKLSSKYTIRITPTDPVNSRERSADSNGDGVPDGIQTDTNYALGVDGIGESIPQAINSVGYEGKLYNGIPRTQVYFSPDILPQRESRMPLYKSEDERGIMEVIFANEMDRPFLKMEGNFRDDFYDEDIYVTVPLTVDIEIEGKIVKREIFSCQLDCPVIIHVPPPGQDGEHEEQLQLQLFTPLNFRGGGLVRVSSQGSELNGKAWVNIPMPRETLKLVFEEFIKKIKEAVTEAMMYSLVSPVLGVLVGLIKVVYAAWSFFSEIKESFSIENVVFIPGIGWNFDDGFLTGLKEYLYDIMPGVTEPA